MSDMKWWMQKYHNKNDNVHYIRNNYALKSIYND